MTNTDIETSCNAVGGGNDNSSRNNSTIINTINDFIDRSFPDRLTDDLQKKQWHLVRAMFAGYIALYTSEDFTPVALEIPFCRPILNPETGHPATSFRIAGRADGLIRHEKTGNYFLLEHKTASSIDGNYLEDLPHDFQTASYMHFLGCELGIKIKGVLYNVIGKSQIRQGKGETELEFEERRAKLIAKSKSGKSTAQLQLPESDEDFQSRLLEKYKDEEMFHRELLYFPESLLAEVQQEIWDVKDQMLYTRRTQKWLRVPRRCKGSFGSSRCDYYDLCWSANPGNFIENDFRKRESAHSELAGSGMTDNPGNLYELLTYSSISTFRDCPRKYYWRYVEQIEPIDDYSEALWLGSCWHKVLEMWYSAQLDPMGITSLILNSSQKNHKSENTYDAPGFNFNTNSDSKPDSSSNRDDFGLSKWDDEFSNASRF